MNRPFHNVSRHPNMSPHLASPQNLRLGTLILLFVAINQVDDPLIDATIGQELMYWCVRIIVLAGGLWAAEGLVSRVLAGRWANPPWLKPVVLVSAIGLLPLALAEILIEPHLPMRPEFVDDDLWAYSPALALLSEYATIVSILIPIHLLLWLIVDRRVRDAGSASGTGSATRPDFLEQASVDRAEDILALQAEDHYVRIFTKSGAELIHCRFGDAVAKMPSELGLRVHRSWWVAGNAVRSAKRGSRRWHLNLLTDVSVPVSDSFVQAVRERGWLRRKAQTP